MKALLFLLMAVPSLAFAQDKGPDRLKVLLLTYNWPAEHNVMQSLLCLQPCTKENKCPEQYLKYQKNLEKQEVFWNDDFVVVRPYQVGTPSEVVEGFKDFSPDFVSMSGHHSAGFFGERGNFNLEGLRFYEDPQSLRGVFGTPSLVMLNGCNTEVKSDFIGDPQAYIRHIVEDTNGRIDNTERLMQAISQVSGVQKTYRSIYPNACIMGYAGTSQPGGVPQIYAQYANVFRTLYYLNEGKEFAPRVKMLEGDYSKNEYKVFDECPGRAWPCNLCKTDSKYYGTLKNSLAKYLRNEKARRNNKINLPESEVLSTEKIFFDNGFYKNAKWACTGTADVVPTVPSTKNLPNSSKLLLNVLLIPPSARFTDGQLLLLYRELLHQLAMARIPTDELSQMQAILLGPEQRNLFATVMTRVRNDFSMFKDFITVAMRLKAESLISHLASSKDSKDREVYASALLPEVGTAQFQALLKDSFSSVRKATASRLRPSMDLELFKLAFSDTNEDVAKAAANNITYQQNDAGDYYDYSNRPRVNERLIMLALNSPHRSVRESAISAIDRRFISSEVMLTLIQIANGLEVTNYISYLSPKHTDEVYLKMLKKVTHLNSLKNIAATISNRQGNEVFKEVLKYSGSQSEVAQVVSEKLGKMHSVEVFKIALTHSDYYVRSGAARRLSERKEPELFLLALSDKDVRIRWAAASNLFPGIDQSVKNKALQDFDKIVQNIAEHALAGGK